MIEQSVVHRTFAIERHFAASPARVFAAFADPATKRRWFAGGEGWEIYEFSSDLRVGGHERARFRFEGGLEIRNDTTYQDVVPNQRIVSAYAMTVGDKRISVSLATVELAPSGSGTHLTYTEQGAFFDGVDKPQSREEGWCALLQRLDEELRSSD